MKTQMCRCTGTARKNETGSLQGVTGSRATCWRALTQAEGSEGRPPGLITS